MKYKVYEIGAECGLSGLYCIDKKNNDLVAIHAGSRDGSEIDDHTIQINPRFIVYIVEVDIDNDLTPHGGKR